MTNLNGRLTLKGRMENGYYDEESGVVLTKEAKEIRNALYEATRKERKIMRENKSNIMEYFKTEINEDIRNFMRNREFKEINERCTIKTIKEIKEAALSQLDNLRAQLDAAYTKLETDCAKDMDAFWSEAVPSDEELTKQFLAEGLSEEIIPEFISYIKEFANTDKCRVMIESRDMDTLKDFIKRLMFTGIFIELESRYGTPIAAIMCNEISLHSFL